MSLLTQATPGSRCSLRTLVVATGLALFAAAPNALAQEASAGPRDLTELSLEELMEIPIETVYGAAKAEQRTTEAPSSVTIVTADDIATFGYRTLADVLRSVRGFYVINDRNYERVGVRGFGTPGDYSSRILFLIDGHRVNDAVYDSAPPGLDFLLDVDLIERVEIIRGPGSSLYGSNAFFAVVNVRTKRADALGFPEVSVEAQSYGGYRMRTTFAKVLAPGREFIVSATGFTREGADLFYEEFAGTPSGGNTEGRDGEDGYNLFARFGFDEWTLEAGRVSRLKEIPTGSYGTVFDDPRIETLDEHTYVDLGWDRADDGPLDLRSRVYFDDYQYRGTYVYDFTSDGGPPDTPYDDRGTGTSAGTELTATWRGWTHHRLTLGSEARYDFDRDQHAQDAFNGTTVDVEKTGGVWGVYAQDEIELSERVALNVGARYDRDYAFGGTINPRLALVWSPDESRTWKLLGGTAFRAPNAYELYYDDGSTAGANVDLQPETIRSVELVHERRFGKTWSASLSAFQYQIDDLIVQETDPSSGLLVFTNSEGAQALGSELDVEHRFAGGSRVRAAYAWVDVEEDETGERPANSPEHLAKLQLDRPFFDGRMRGAVELLGMSDRSAVSGADVEGHLLVNLTLRSTAIAPGCEIFIGLRNLFDASYGDPSGPEHTQDEIEQDGRSFFVRLVLSH